MAVRSRPGTGCFLREARERFAHAELYDPIEKSTELTEVAEWNARLDYLSANPPAKSFQRFALLTLILQTGLPSLYRNRERIAGTAISTLGFVL